MKMSLHEAELHSCTMQESIVDIDVHRIRKRDEQVLKALKNPHKFRLELMWEILEGRHFCKILAWVPQSYSRLVTLPMPYAFAIEGIELDDDIV